MVFLEIKVLVHEDHIVLFILGGVGAYKLVLINAIKKSFIPNHRFLKLLQFLVIIFRLF